MGIVVQPMLIVYLANVDLIPANLIHTVQIWNAAKAVVPDIMLGM